VATSDRSRFNGILAELEQDMSAMFKAMVGDIIPLLLSNAGPEGTVPVEKLRALQEQVSGVVERYMVGTRREPFDRDFRPGSAYAEIIARGQGKMIDLALTRSASTWSHLPAELVMQVQRQLERGAR